MTDRTDAQMATYRILYGSTPTSVAMPEKMQAHIQQRTCTEIRIPLDPQPEGRYTPHFANGGANLMEWDGDEYGGMELNQGFIPCPFEVGKTYNFGDGLFQKVTDISVKQLWEDTEAELSNLGILGVTVIVDAHCAGGIHQEVTQNQYWANIEDEDEGTSDPEEAYEKLWASCYGQELCDSNPWVWVVTLEIQPDECWATFVRLAGYDPEIHYARSVLTMGERYRVVGGEEGSWHTDLLLEGFDRPFNSVMFEIEGEYPPNFRRWRYPR